MDVIRDGELYKAVRVTGPSHNYLGLAFAGDPRDEAVGFEVLPPPPGAKAHGALPKDAVLRAVFTGVDNANALRGASLQVKFVRVVASDTIDLFAYATLANGIAQSAILDRRRLDASTTR